ncbi:MAG: hypothetical protein ACO3A5_08135 [Bacteroidia bacterium]
MEINKAFAKVSLSMTVFTLWTIANIGAQNLEFPKNIPRTPSKPQFNPPSRPTQQSPSNQRPPSIQNRPRIPAPSTPSYPFPIYYPQNRTPQQVGSGQMSEPVYSAPLYIPDKNGVTHVPFLSSQNQFKMYHCPNPAVYQDPWLIKTGALDTLKAMAPKIETFDINHAEKAFEIKTKTGITLKFPENAFSDAMGNPVLGRVQLSVQHFQSKTDFASAGLSSSTSDGQALESGGMIDINAKSGNADVRIADGKSYKIEGNSAYKEGFETFYGVGGNQTTWTNNPNAATANSQTANNSEGSDIKNRKFTLSLLPITRSVNGVAHSLIVNDLGDDMPLSQWFYNNAKISKDLKKRIKMDGIVFPARLTFSKTGEITDVQLIDSSQAASSIISDQFGYFRELLLSAPKAKFNDSFGLPESIVIRFSTLDANFNTIKQLPLPPVVAGLGKMATNNGGNWALESYSTHLVNCDRFSKYKKSDDSITYKVDHARALVYLNFSDINALLAPSTIRQEQTGYAYAMHQFPEGSHARLIAIVYDQQGGVHLEVSDVSPGNYHIQKTSKYPFNQLTVRAAFEMMPMDLFPAKN